MAVVLPIYATETDYAEFVGPDAEPVDDAFLARASRVIDSMARWGRYSRDTDTGIPLDETIAEYFKLATCAQAQYWMQQGGDATGIVGTYDVVQMAGVSFGRRPQSGENLSLGNSRRSPEAMDLLRQAGIFSTKVSSNGYWPGRA